MDLYARKARADFALLSVIFRLFPEIDIGFSVNV
jgi:hypothetical protein